MGSHGVDPSRRLHMFFTESPQSITRRKTAGANRVGGGQTSHVTKDERVVKGPSGPDLCSMSTTTGSELTPDPCSAERSRPERLPGLSPTSSHSPPQACGSHVQYLLSRTTSPMRERFRHLASLHLRLRLCRVRAERVPRYSGKVSRLRNRRAAFMINLRERPMDSIGCCFRSRSGFRQFRTPTTDLPNRTPGRRKAGAGMITESMQADAQESSVVNPGRESLELAIVCDSARHVHL
jgi:hypothetical protein